MSLARGTDARCDVMRLQAPRPEPSFGAGCGGVAVWRGHSRTCICMHAWARMRGRASVTPPHRHTRVLARVCRVALARARVTVPQLLFLKGKK
jgi:hypothetical protein